MSEPSTIELTSVADTGAAGERLGRAASPGDVVGLIGDLGAGKTTLVQAVAAGLAVPAAVRVTSPTFTLINEYRGGRMPLYHADLYRIERRRELDEIGLDELVRRGDGLVMVEWCDRFPVLGADWLEVRLEVAGEHARRLSAAAHGPRAAELLVRWRAQK